MINETGIGTAMAFLALDDIDQKELIPGFRVRFVHTDNMTVAHWDVEEGSSLPEHSHPHEQVTNVIEGIFEMTVGGATRILKEGDVAVISCGKTHSGKAITDCRIIDVFYPARDDYKN